MDLRVWKSGASATPPAPPAIPSIGHPTEGDPSLGIAPTKGGAYYYYQIAEELRAVLLAAGLTPNHEDLTQLLTAVNTLSHAPGEIIDFAGTTAPAGYLACPLAPTNISRTAYAALFAAIGTTWGDGDGVTTFGMPYFPANYVGLQANANVGSAHVGEVLAHVHSGVVVGHHGNNGGVGPGTSELPIIGITGSTGGPANIAAGIRILKCVKY